MYCAAEPARTTTRNSAACTTLLERTTPIAAPAIASAMIQKATCCSHIALLLLLRLVGAGLERLRLGDRLHPLAEFHLVVQELRDAALGVLVFRAPEERVERADLDADPAVHAQRVVDVEPVEHRHRALTATFTPRRSLLLVALDVDAPVGARPCAQHADRAVLLLECDHAARAGSDLFLLVRVLHRD